jgi:hypothetical protein
MQVRLFLTNVASLLSIYLWVASSQNIVLIEISSYLMENKHGGL